MGKKIIGLVLMCVMALSLVLASCSTKSTTTSSTTPATTSMTTKTSTTSSTTTTTTTTKVTTTTTKSGNWWDALGAPTYGGTLTVRQANNFVFFDPAQGEQGVSLMTAWMEQLFLPNWTLDPSVMNYQIGFHSSDQEAGVLATSWQFTDPNTVVISLRKGIHWQNIAPANGREFVASDVVNHFDRMLGLGNGYNKPMPWWSLQPSWALLTSVTALDKYTVSFKWNVTNQEFILETLMYTSIDTCIESPEAVSLWGDVYDWHHAIGTGPFILQDFVSDGSATLVRNPNYWGTDERHPQNQVPYVDKVSFLIIPNDATALAGVRTGKIDAMDNISLQTAQQMQRSNPEILQITYAANNAAGIEPRNDKAPFNDLRVREALQKSIDLQTIAKTYYGGTCSPNPSSMTSNLMTGWGLPYDQWPQDVKDLYSYDPTVAKKLLADAGYPNGFDTNIVCNNTGDIDLIQIVKSYFAAIGVNMSISTMDPASFTAFVKVGHKQDALDNRPVLPLGKLNSPFVHLASLNTGNSDDVPLVNDPVFNAFYTQAMAATTIDQIKAAVKAANLYQAQHIFIISLLQPSLFAFCQPWLKGFSEQNGFLNPVGPTCFSLYAARFWIDQDLKKSTGH